MTVQKLCQTLLVDINDEVISVIEMLLKIRSNGQIN